MPERLAPIAKITRPKIRGVFPRERLFGLLDETRKYPVTWISAPAGSGKTTLVASYLDAQKIPCLWYQVDGGDADPATFFYYMGQAAKKASPRKHENKKDKQHYWGIHNYFYFFYVHCSRASRKH